MSLKHRKEKRARKREDLDYLVTLLNNFGPQKQTQDELLHEQLLSAIAQRTENEQLSPLRMREAGARVGSLEDTRGYEKEFQPLRVADMQSQTRARNTDADFAQQSLAQRLEMIGLENKGRGLQNQAQEAILPHVGQSAFLDNAIKGHQSSMFPVQRRALESETKARNQAISQEDEMHPVQMRTANINQAAMLQQQAAMAQEPFSPSGFLRQQGINLPKPVDPSAPGFQADAMLNSGIMGDITAPGSRQWLSQNMPAISQVSQNPSFEPGPMTQQLLELQNNPQPYGMTQFDPKFLTPEMLQHVQNELKKRIGQQTKLPY